MFVRRHANRLALVGFAKNLPDGRVEVVAEGPPEAQRALEEALRDGPLAARVLTVEKSEILDEIDVLKAFEII